MKIYFNFYHQLFIVAVIYRVNTLHCFGIYLEERDENYYNNFL